VERALNVADLRESPKLDLPKMEREPLVVVVLGPTASGKTALALAIARRFHGEVVNCDSVAMYREFENRQAKPTAGGASGGSASSAGCVDPLADVTAGEYARQARQVLREIVQRSHLPIISGGTGLYLRALLEDSLPGRSARGLCARELRDRLRARVEKRGAEHLPPILRRLDAAAAKRIHANDIPKVIRAIEVCLSSRQASSQISPELLPRL